MRRKANNSIELAGFDLRVKYHPKVCSAALMVPLSKSTAISENSSLLTAIQCCPVLLAASIITAATLFGIDSMGTWPVVRVVVLA